MAFSRLERRADELALDAGRLKRERNAHVLRCVAILRSKLATPPALILCFAAGMLAGEPARPREPTRENAGRGREARRKRGVGRLLAGSLGTAALRLASAYVAGSSVK